MRRVCSWPPYVSLSLKAYLLTYLLTYVLTYVLTPMTRVLLEKLTGFQLVKKLPVIYGTRRFITAFTSARHFLKRYVSLVKTDGYYFLSHRFS
jgi:hypothetical protein